VAVVPNGVEGEVLDADHGLVDLEGDTSVCYHGRLTYEKGLDLLIQAVAALPEGRREGVHLHLLGRGSMGPALMREAERLGISAQVHFPGYLPKEDVYAHLHSADVLVYPSRFDNFPVSVLEALGLARGPVLFSDRMGISEFGGADLEANIFPLSVDAIRDAVLRVLEGKMDVDAVVDRQRACARRFTWDRVVGEYVDFFNGLP
jgi:glycosyltransferase involved in cell wall biosynthesis